MPSWLWGAVKRVRRRLSLHTEESLSCKSVSEYVGFTKARKYPKSAWFSLCSEEFRFSIAKVENTQSRTHQRKTKESDEINPDEMQLRSDPPPKKKSKASLEVYFQVTYQHLRTMLKNV